MRRVYIPPTFIEVVRGPFAHRRPLVRGVAIGAGMGAIPVRRANQCRVWVVGLRAGKDVLNWHSLRATRTPN